jgi:hypothetical protein
MIAVVLIGGESLRNGDQSQCIGCARGIDPWHPGSQLVSLLAKAITRGMRLLSLGAFALRAPAPGSLLQATGYWLRRLNISEFA